MVEPQPSQDRPQPSYQTLSFEEAFAQLSAMVETLETGSLPLAEAADLYGQGMILTRRCAQLLDEAELKITQIREDAGAPSAADLEASLNPDWGNLEMPAEDGMEGGWNLGPFNNGAD